MKYTVTIKTNNLPLAKEIARHARQSHNVEATVTGGPVAEVVESEVVVPIVPPTDDVPPIVPPTATELTPDENGGVTLPPFPPELGTQPIFLPIEEAPPVEEAPPIEEAPERDDTTTGPTEEEKVD